MDSRGLRGEVQEIQEENLRFREANREMQQMCEDLQRMQRIALHKCTAL